jgi:hypothetical protein
MNQSKYFIAALFITLVFASNNIVAQDSANNLIVKDYKSKVITELVTSNKSKSKTGKLKTKQKRKVVVIERIIEKNNSKNLVKKNSKDKELMSALRKLFKKE